MSDWELSVDVLRGASATALSLPLPCGLSASAGELKRRVRAALAASCPPGDASSIELADMKLFYCGELLHDGASLPASLRLVDPSEDPVFAPRCESETGDAPVDGRLAPQSSRRSQRARSKGSSARSLGGASYRSRSARDVLRSRSAELAPLALVGLAPPGAMDLQAELAKIDCAAHAPALLAAGMLWDEAALVRVTDEELSAPGLWVPRRARERILALGATLRARLGLRDPPPRPATQQRPARRVYYTRAAVRDEGGPDVAEARPPPSPRSKRLDAAGEALVARIRGRGEEAVGRRYCCPAHESACRAAQVASADAAVACAEVRVLAALIGAADQEFLSLDALRMAVLALPGLDALGPGPVEAAIQSSMRGHECDLKLFARTLAGTIGGSPLMHG